MVTLLRYISPPQPACTADWYGCVSDRDSEDPKPFPVNTTSNSVRFDAELGLARVVLEARVANHDAPLLVGVANVNGAAVRGGAQLLRRQKAVVERE